MLRPDRQDFQGTAVTIEVARKLPIPRMLLVVNLVLPSLDFGHVRRDVEQTYRTPVAGALPASDDVLRLASRGLFAVRYPDHPWSLEIRAITRQLTC